MGPGDSSEGHLIAGWQRYNRLRRRCRHSKKSHVRLLASDNQRVPRLSVTHTLQSPWPRTETSPPLAAEPSAKPRTAPPKAKPKPPETRDITRDNLGR